MTLWLRAGTAELTQLHWRGFERVEDVMVQSLAYL